MKTMHAPISHLVYLIQDFDKNIDIYRKLFAYFDYKVLTDESYGLGVMSPNNCSIWIMDATTKNPNDRDSNGLNHLAFGVDSQEAVDTFTNEFLKENKIESLFGTPTARPDFTGENGIYYQVMFELPGSLLFEVVYTSY
jgi:hypothetical protein